MTAHADAVLPLIRTRADLHHWSAANAHGAQTVAYAPVLGEKGIASYRARLDEVASDLGPKPPEDRRWSSPHSHEWFILDWNARRLAVLDRDVAAIIRSHARDRKVAASQPARRPAQPGL